jgi:type IV pilus assembly protein PilQ
MCERRSVHSPARAAEACAILFRATSITVALLLALASPASAGPPQMSDARGPSLELHGSPATRAQSLPSGQVGDHSVALVKGIASRGAADTAGVAVTGVAVQPGSAGETTIVVTAEAALAEHELFMLPDPPRLVLDLPNARHALRQPVAVPAASPVLRVRTTQYRERPVPTVRLVIDLARSVTYRLEPAGNRIVISMREQGPSLTPPARATTQEEMHAAAPTPGETPSGLPATGDPVPASAPPPPPSSEAIGEASEGRQAPVLSTTEPTAPAPAEHADVGPAGGPTQSAATAARATPRPIRVTGVAVRSAGPTGATIVVTAEAALSEHEPFALPDPPRVVLDFPNTRHAVRQPVAVPAGSPVLRIRTTQYRERPVPTVRLVIDLARQLPFKAEQTAGGFRVAIGEPPAEPVPPPVVTETPKKPDPPKVQPARTPPAPVLAAKPPGESRPSRPKDVPAVGERPSPPTAPEATPAPGPPPAPARTPETERRISLDFKNADLDDLLRLISEVSGLNVVAAHGLKDAKVTIRLIDVDWRQALDLILRSKNLSYEQDGNVVYVGSKDSIQKAKEERARDIQDAEIRRLKAEEEKRKLDEARRKREEERRRAAEEDRRYAAEPPCTRLVRLAHIKASEAKKHLDRLKTRRGSVEVDDRTNTLVINDAESVCVAMARIATELDAPPKDPFISKMIPYNYAKASDLRTHLAALKTPQGSVVVDERSSRIIVKDLPPAVERMETFLKQIDIPTPQVLIEARIVEASRTFTQSLGIQWGGAGVPTSPGSRTGITGFGGAGSPLNIQFPTISPRTSPFLDPADPNPIPFAGPVPLALSLPAIGTNPFVLGATIGSLANRYLVGAQLSAAEREGRIRTLSSPRVATQDNEEAEIKQGTQVPFTTIDASGRTVVSFQEAFIKLKVKPHITPDGRVSMKVEAERSFPGDRIDFTGGFAFPINTRKATTNILVPNGSTIVIGGLLQSTESIAVDQVPLLGRIPVLGWFFKRRSLGPDDRVELLIFLTPSILQEART